MAINKKVSTNNKGYVEEFVKQANKRSDKYNYTSIINKVISASRDINNIWAYFRMVVIMVLKTGTVKEPENELITGFMVGSGSDQWSNQ